MTMIMDTLTIYASVGSSVSWCPFVIYIVIPYVVLIIIILLVVSVVEALDPAHWLSGLFLRHFTTFSERLKPLLGLRLHQ